MTLSKILLFIFLVVVVLIFAYYNLGSVEVKFFAFSFDLPLFVVIIGSLFIGFVIAYGYSELRGAALSKYSRNLRSALLNLSLGRYRKAEEHLKRILSREEVIPLYSEVLLEQDKDISLYYERYTMGISETMVAEAVFKKDINRSIDLLEKAVGKNWDNLRARRNLRSLYFLKGYVGRAVEMQRGIVSDSERSERKKEELILIEMLAWDGRDEALTARDGSVCFYLAKIQSGGNKKARKIFGRAVEKGIGNEVLMLALERRDLYPEMLTYVGENESRFSPLILGLLYLQVGRQDRLEDLKENLPEPIKLLLKEGENTRGECLKELLQMMKVWRCTRCGAETKKYMPVCSNCLRWDSLRFKGGV